jgi:glycosyltransferase involved in cell wall biosynthesis
MARLLAVRARFGRYLRDNRIDVVACTMPHLWNVAMLRQIRRAGARYLLTIHDATLHTGEDFRVRRWLLGREALEADTIVALSEHVRRQLVAIYGIRPGGAPILHGPERNGPTAAAQVPDGRAVGLALRRLLPHGPRSPLDATSLRRQFNVELVVAGAGTLPGHSAMLRATPGVRVENKWICETNVDDLFREADLVLLPYREASQSGVIAHAFEHRLPVVATPVGGLVEQVTHMRTGLIARSVSAEGIADAAATLLRAPALYEECSAEIGRVVESSMAWPRIGAAMSRVIKDTAG